MKAKRPKPISSVVGPAPAFAWVFPERDAYGLATRKLWLCSWAEPARDVLERRGKPTSDAQVRRVYIVTAEWMREARAAMKKAKQ